MAKELPYFKFEPNQWENGNIQICSREDKGLFIDLCSMYWSRLGDVPQKLAIQKLCAGNATALDSLIENSIIEVNDGKICIDFLNEQLSEFESVSKVNSKNALLGWKKRRKDATAMRPHSERNAIRGEESRVDEKRKDDIDSELEFFVDKVEAFEAWKSNTMLVEELKLLISRLGFRSVTEAQVINVMRNFLLVEYRHTKTKADLESHLRRWINKMGVKISEYAK